MNTSKNFHNELARKAKRQHAVFVTPPIGEGEHITLEGDQVSSSYVVVRNYEYGPNGYLAQFDKRHADGEAFVRAIRRKELARKQFAASLVGRTL